VKDANPVFDRTHEKSMVVDDELAVVNSLNWTKRNLTKTRDYAVLTTRSHDVDEIGECFDADWRRQDFVPRSRSHLIWCPGFARDRICQFIDDARHRLLIQNERFQDMVIVERLIRARQRGVKVSIMARPPHTLKRDKLVEGVGGLRILDDVGIRIRSIRHVKLHGKILLADRTAAIVGSINFAAGTFDGRRELAIEVRDAAVVDRLEERRRGVIGEHYQRAGHANSAPVLNRRRDGLSAAVDLVRDRAAWIASSMIASHFRYGRARVTASAAVPGPPLHEGSARGIIRAPLRATRRSRNAASRRWRSVRPREPAPRHTPAARRRPSRSLRSSSR
jgi:phosphatidylserine/phosphatidylglycerophosphate/cardiolipin synthase-like enzyme